MGEIFYWYVSIAQNTVGEILCYFSIFTSVTLLVESCFQNDWHLKLFENFASHM